MFVQICGGGGVEEWRIISKQMLVRIWLFY